MDTIIRTSLEALLLKATNSNNLNIDTAAVDAFCALINKEKDSVHIGVKVIADRLPTGNEKEVLQTLNILDACMSKCGNSFQNEVGKFRFLNEMIKLVSPKYLGQLTPLTIKQKVLQLLYVWTLDYPKESKIKEAFDMLRKQGVVREIPNPNVPSHEPVNIPKKRSTSSVFQDEEKSKVLQKLLQSKDPEDIQAANWLIKSMVKEDDKRAEMKSRRVTELESVQNNVRLLNEMLDSYKSGNSSTGELDLITELYQNCERLRPTINKIALETHHSEGMLGDVLSTIDELSAVFNKYNILILQAKSNHELLLRFENSDSKVEQQKDLPINAHCAKSSVDVLCDIFTASSIPDSGEVLQPTSILKCEKSSVCDDDKEKTNKFKALEDLDVLGEHLLKGNLQYVRQASFDSKTQGKIPMNLLSSNSPKTKQVSLEKLATFNLDINFLDKPKLEMNSIVLNDDCNRYDTNDDILVDISDENMLDVDRRSNKKIPSTSAERVKDQLTDLDVEKCKRSDIKLNDIFIKLEDIKPSSYSPTILMEEKHSINVNLHLAKDKPKEGVNVYVLTTISKNEFPLNNYLFQAVVPKCCKLKLQQPSATELPAYNPFLPPSAITQIMLIANPHSIEISLKYIVSYTMDDDTITEMGSIDKLPML